MVLALRLILAMILTRGARDVMVGQLAADVVRWLFVAPFRFLRWVARLAGIIK